jgi:hypothetical protein
MSPGVVTRRAATRACGIAVAETLRRRARTVVGKTAATFTSTPTTDSPRIVLERDISASAWQLLSIAGTASVGEMMYFDGSDWVVLPAAGEGEVLTMVSGIPRWQALP